MRTAGLHGDIQRCTGRETTSKTADCSLVSVSSLLEVRLEDSR